MNNIRICSVLFSSLLLLVACSAEDVTKPLNNQTKAISFQAGIKAAVSTRADTTLLDGKFGANSRIGVYIQEDTYEEPTINYEQPIEFKVNDAQGNMAPVSGVNPFYPTNGNGILISAVYPYKATQNEDYTFSVSTEQNDTYNFLQSDLMAVTNVISTIDDDHVDLEFEHLLSKITVILRSTAADIKLDNSNVYVTSTFVEGTFDPMSGVIGDATGNEWKPIRISTDGSKACSGIIIPQTINAGDQFITINLAAGDEVYGIMPNDFTFEPGKAYTFRIDVKVDRVQSKVLLTDVQIADWVEAFSEPRTIDGQLKE